ncbi:hypothetical protein [Nocardia suismassiliense]|uniref:hypothetical protein n=1 Tax=Nocardia suismassiliense TaxID=2077092 RepID=UPI000D1E0F9C|nr:hypothetical protein [Nocardia suismassiliense]
MTREPGPGSASADYLPATLAGRPPHNLDTHLATAVKVCARLELRLAELAATHGPESPSYRAVAEYWHEAEQIRCGLATLRSRREHGQRRADLADAEALRFVARFRTWDILDAATPPSEATAQPPGPAGPQPLRT